MNNKHYVGKRVASLESYGRTRPVDGIALLVDDEHEYRAGDQTGYVLEIECPYGTQAMADALMEQIGGRSYTGYTAVNAVMDPEAELGDGVTVGGGYELLASRQMALGSGHLQIGAPPDSETDHEYGVADPTMRQIERKLASTRSYIEKTSEEIKLGIEDEMNGRLGEITLRIDGVEATFKDDMAGLSAEFKAGLEGVESRITSDMDGRFSEFRQDLDGFSATVQGINGEISNLKQTDKDITARLEDAEGRVGTLEVTARSITGKIEGLDGRVGTLELTDSQLLGRIEGLDGRVGALELTDSHLLGRIEDGEGRIGTLELTASSLSSDIYDPQGAVHSLVTQTASEITSKVQAVDEKAVKALNDYADTVTASLSDLQDQIDGTIEVWYYSYAPTTSNVPASSWRTTAEKQKHIGDLFYVVNNSTIGGRVYRWALISGTYQWQLVEDVELEKALATAAEAKDTADNKRRVFTTQPTPPYDVGDLWAGGPNGDLMRCKRARSGGSYYSIDWEKAAWYTDETQVGSMIKQEIDKITLSVTGSLGGEASITLSGGGGGSGKIDLSDVRQAFANDETAIAISAGTVRFATGMLLVNTTSTGIGNTTGNISIDKDGKLRATKAKLIQLELTGDSGGYAFPYDIDDHPEVAMYAKGDIDLLPYEAGKYYSAGIYGYTGFLTQRLELVYASYFQSKSWACVGWDCDIYLRCGSNHIVKTDRAIDESSDRDLKKDIKALDGRYVSFLDGITPASFRYKGEDDNAPVTVGYIAQDVEAALGNAGLTREDFAGLTGTNGEGDMGLAYSTFIPIMHLKINDLEKRLKRLEAAA